EQTWPEAVVFAWRELYLPYSSAEEERVNPFEVLIDDVVSIRKGAPPAIGMNGLIPVGPDHDLVRSVRCPLEQGSVQRSVIWPGDHDDAVQSVLPRVLRHCH